MRNILSALLATAAVVAGSARAADAPAPAGAGAAKPNILYIMTDDHAAHALSCYGSVINQTPNLDRIAKDGVRFDRFFVTNSICTPSRAVMLTGQYSHINGVPVFNHLDPARPNVAKYLQQAGYHTAVIGKWHLGSQPTGFDHWNILPGQGVYYDPVFITPQGRKDMKGYVTDITTDLAIDYLNDRPKDKPFFLMYHQKAPHRSWEPGPKYKDEFRKRVIPEPPTLYDDYSTRTDAIKENQQRVFDDLTRRDLKLEPPADLPAGPERNKWLQAKPTEVEIEVDGQKKVLTGDALNKWKYQRYLQDYLACVQSVDDGVGTVLDYLDKNGLRDNTMVVYTSDQGFFLGDNGMYDKRFMYEPCFKTPLLVRWPGVAKPGTVQKAITGNQDFAPTFLSAAGAPIPPDMQGKSFIPLLKGETPSDWRKSFYYRYYHDPGHHNTARHMGVRTETHKLIHFFKKDQWELFDLTKDPHELKNVYDDPAYATTRDELKAELQRLKKELKDEDQFAEVIPKDDVDAMGQAAAGGGGRPAANPPRGGGGNPQGGAKPGAK